MFYYVRNVSTVSHVDDFGRPTPTWSFHLWRRHMNVTWKGGGSVAVCLSVVWSCQSNAWMRCIYVWLWLFQGLELNHNSEKNILQRFIVRMEDLILSQYIKYAKNLELQHLFSGLVLVWYRLWASNNAGKCYHPQFSKLMWNHPWLSGFLSLLGRHFTQSDTDGGKNVVHFIGWRG